MQWFRNLNAAIKLMLGFGLAGLALVVPPLVMYMVQSNGEIRTARLEQAGVAPSKALIKVVQLVQQHRGLSSNTLGGNTTMETQRAAKRTEADKAVEAFDAFMKSEITDPAIANGWTRAVESWRALESSVSSRSITGKESFARHTALIGEYLKLLDLMLDSFGLSLDPSSDGYHLITATLVHMPDLTEILGQARARGSLYLATKSITTADRLAVAALLDRANSQHESMAREIGKAMVVSPQVKAVLGGLAQESAVLVQKGVDLARTQVVDAQILSYAPAEYFAVFTEVIDGQVKLLATAMEELDKVLLARIAGLRSGQAKVIGFIALAIAFAVWLGTVITRAVTDSVREVMGVAEKAATGDFGARAALTSHDELGRMGQAVNRMLARLEDSVGQVMAVLAKATAGDLTPRVRVTGEDRLAQMGIALNQMLESFHDSMVRVQQAQNRLLIQATALEAAANGIVITDRQGTVLWINPAFTQLTGYTAEEAISGNPRTLKSGKHDQAFYQHLWETILAGQVWHGETINRRKDGSLYTEEQTITPMRDERGEITHFIAIKEDITDRKRAEAEVRDLNLKLTERAERLQAIVRLTKIVNSSLDLWSLYQGFAQEVKRFAPYDRMELVMLNGAGRGFRILELQADRPTHREPERHASREERTDIEWVMAQRQPHIESDLAEARQFGEDEALLTMGIRCCLRLPLIVKGKVIGVLCLKSIEPHRYGAHALEFLGPLGEQLAIAIENASLYEAATTATTALKQAQTVLVETERLRAMGELAAGVAHDFNNALAGVLGQTLLLRTLLQATPIPTEMIQEALARQEQAALDAAETVRRIREATRPRGREAFVPVALNEVVRTVVETTRPRWKDQVERQGRTITVATELSAVPMILGQEAELREALTNLLFNAVDAMPTGGTITIATRHVRSAETEESSLLPRTSHLALRTVLDAPRTSDSAEFVELAVTDTGIGMTEAVQTRLFEPFFTTKGVRGSGLGLSMVRGIVHRHSGEIRIVSVPGKGTTVTFRFPEAARAAVLDAEGPTTAMPLLPHPLKILVIDDVFGLAQVCCDLLTAMGHEAEAAGGGQDGLQRLQIAPFDLVMTDLGMPEVSGWDVAAAVKARCPTCPVILVTGWGEVGNELEGTGVDLVLAKPYTKAALEAVLAQAWGLTQRSSG